MKNKPATSVRGAAEYGFVYVLSNASMPDMYKIGYTTIHPKARMKELGRATACATPFDLVVYYGCRQPHLIEKAIHRSLDQHRVNSGREFFKIDLIEILETIESIFQEFDGFLDESPYFDGFHADVLFNAYMQRDRDDKQWKINHFHEQSADPICWEKRGFN